MATTKITPDTKFVVYNNALNQPLNQFVLTVLYLPIIESTAFALYNWLWTTNTLDNNQLKLHTHFEIQNLLGISLAQLTDAKQKLEATGLMRTFTNENNTHLSYCLKRPLLERDFFKTDILAVLLLSKIGEGAFNQIKGQLLNNQINLDDGEDVSSSFLEVFSPNEDALTNIPEVVTKSQQEISAEPDGQSLLNPNAPDFDFNLLLDTLTSSYVNSESVKKNYELIISEHLVYGINELQMSKLIQQATNFKTNELDSLKLKMLISKMYSSNNRKPQVNSKNLEPTDNQVTTNFDKQTNLLIEISKKTAPGVFLKQLKRQKKGYPSTGEQRTLRDLIGYRVLNNEVINILIYHVLIDEDNPTLNRNLVDTIANNWSQENIGTAQEAIQFIRNRDTKKREAKKATPKKRTPVVKETLPDWAQEDYQANSKKQLSKDEQQFLADRIKKLQEGK